MLKNLILRILEFLRIVGWRIFIMGWREIIVKGILVRVIIFVFLFIIFFLRFKLEDNFWFFWENEKVNVMYF